MSTTNQVSVVVCTMNSLSSIEACHESLREAQVGEIIVVDARSKDGTRAVVDRLADVVLEDPGIGLGTARNMGIAKSSLPYVLNLGSDNVLPRESLKKMISQLEAERLHGIGATTRVAGDDYLARSMNAWWSTRFRSGPAKVIGTPSLFRGETLRADPFDTSREHSDDSELCERWARKYSARFAIAEATVYEVGKNEWSEVLLRARNYGVSDHEVFSAGSKSGWGIGRRLMSLSHPLRVDFLQPESRLDLKAAVVHAPFLAAFTGLRYLSWAQTSIRKGSRP